MDAIDRIIIRKGYDNLPLNRFRYTWQNFEQNVGTGRFYLYGVGKGADFYYLKYGNYAKVNRVFDNNNNLHGVPLRAVTPAFDSNEELLIESAQLIKDNVFHDGIFLIASLNFFEEIADELERLGIKRYYSVLCMEAKARREHASTVIYDNRESWLQKHHHMFINPRKICICTNCDGAGHAKAIVDALLKIRNDLDIVWLLDSWWSKLDSKIRKRLKINAYACDYEYATSYIWIRDSGGGEFHTTIEKKSRHIGIELKHWSSVTLKKFSFDEKSLIENLDRKNYLKRNSSMIDYVMVGSSFDEKTCRSGLGVDGEYIHIGSPRSDILFKKNRREMLYSQYFFLKNKHVILYAPTFRRVGENLSEVSYRHDLDFDLLQKSLKDKFGGDWCILLRLHPIIAQYSTQISLPEYVLDVSNYQDVEELVAASDALITDYSSIMFEPAYINIPVFLFATDLEEYTSQERDFYIDYETLPFPIAKSNEELRKKIVDFDEQKYKNDVKIFFNKYGVHEDGHAAERAAKFISDLIDEKVKEERNDKL